jgi:hypothetical protein
METVTRVMQSITELTGPSCCKAYVRAAVTAAVNLFGEKFGIALPVSRTSVVCEHADRHPHGCREEKCPFYLKPVENVFTKASFVPGTVCTT